MQQNIQDRVHHGLQDDIYKVNHQAVKDALNKMKVMKMQYCLINTSNKLIDHVTTLFKWFLATGKITAFLLLCTLVPIGMTLLPVTITGKLPLEA